MTLRWDTTVPANLESLLPRTVYGTEGKLRYRHQDPLTKLRKMPHRWILTIQWKNMAAAVAVYIQRSNHGQKVFYVRYVAFDEIFKTKSASYMQERRPLRIKNNHIRQSIADLLHAKLGEGSPNIVYSYIEVDNQPSVQLSQSFGFEKIRTMQTLVFNRFFPKVYGNVSTIEEVHKPWVLDQLRQRYHSYNFFVEEGLFDSGTYYVRRDGEDLVAGLKASVVHWDIVHLPGPEGFVIQKVLPWLPILSKRFHKKLIRFAGFEAVWYKEGHEQAVFELMETACATSGLYMGMIWCDTTCTLGRMLEQSGRLGWLHKLNKSGHAHVMAHFEGYGDAEKRSYHEKPVYISAFDVT